MTSRPTARDESASCSDESFGSPSRSDPSVCLWKPPHRSERKILLTHWHQWVKTATHDDQRRAREAARERLRDSIGKAELRLDDLPVGQLPQRLPQSLLMLSVKNCGLTSLPELPAQLEGLMVANNPHLAELPTPLPTLLAALDASQCGLTSLPELPAQLVNLHVNDNPGLRTLPSRLPAVLRFVYAARCGLTGMPELPVHLELADLHDNRALMAAPARLPQSLRYLDLSGCSLRALPPTLLTESSELYVNLRENPLRNATITTLQRLSADPDYRGPDIEYSPPSEASEVRRPLPEILGHWLGAVPAPAGWSELESAAPQEVGHWAELLEQLSDSLQHNNPAVSNRVVSLIHRLPHEPQLRRKVFEICHGAAATCEDRAALAWNDIEKAVLVDDVSRGHYDAQLPRLIELGRGMFRLDELEKLARQHVRSAGVVDEIEVYLAYQIALKDELALPIDTDAMRWFVASGVTERDVAQGLATVRAAELTQFPDYLARWAPLHAVIERLEPVPFEAAQALRQQAIAPGGELPRRVAERLHELGSQGDSGAEAQAARAIMDEIDKRIFGSLTTDFLSRRGLSAGGESAG